MIKSQDIPIFNVYYMLAYAFEFVDDGHLKSVGSEKFENQRDLLASLLAAGVGRQLKQGLCRTYSAKTESLMGVRGRIDISATMSNRFARKREIGCEFDDLTEDNAFNRILKATARLLVKSPDVCKKTRDTLKKAILFFGEVSTLQPGEIRWEDLRFHRNNLSYRLLMSICQLVIEGMLMTDGDGDVLAPAVREEQMHRLYERFILKYYEKHWRQLNPSALQISWTVDDGYTTMLPIMQSDIAISNGRHLLIIDAKYYASTLQVNERWGSETIHSSNLYQIFAYVKNAASANPKRDVSGMLLYAQTDRLTQPDERYSMDGSPLYVRTLDLSGEFKSIASQLDGIANLLDKENQMPHHEHLSC